MMDPFIENTETPEIRSLRAMRKAAWVIFAFQLLFLLIFMLKCWEAIVLGAGIKTAIGVYALIFTGLMLDILLKHMEQLNYRVTELKLILTLVLFCFPAACMAYYWLAVL